MKNKVIVTALLALAAGFAVAFYRGLEKIKDFDLSDPFDFEEDDEQF
jgi:hypothetical protein